MSGQPIIIRTQANRDFAVRIVGNLKIDPDRPLEVVVQQHRKKRSLDQNALYWKILGIISLETGNEVNALHEWMKRQFSLPKRVTIMGEDYEIYTTAKMTVKEMSEYIDRIYAFAAGEGIILPFPEERQAA
jgi:hypothetical protein